MASITFIWYNHYLYAVWLLSKFWWIFYLGLKRANPEMYIYELFLSCWYKNLVKLGLFVMIFCQMPSLVVLYWYMIWPVSWWRQQMETFSALLAICAGNSSVPGEFPTQRPVTRSFDVFFDLRPNKRLSKQWWGWWFETQSCPLWRHRNVTNMFNWD